jgi:hypothetical protein
MKGKTMLKGYKTYITAGIAVIGAIGAYLVGDVGLADTAQIVVTALLGAFIRHGVTTEVTK